MSSIVLLPFYPVVDWWSRVPCGLLLCGHRLGSADALPYWVLLSFYAHECAYAVPSGQLLSFRRCPIADGLPRGQPLRINQHVCANGVRGWQLLPHNRADDCHHLSFRFLLSRWCSGCH